MCCISKKVKEKALKTSQKQLKEEYMASEEKLKFYHFTAQKKLLNDELKKHRVLEKAMMYQHTKRYAKKIKGAT